MRRRRVGMGFLIVVLLSIGGLWFGRDGIATWVARRAAEERGFRCAELEVEVESLRRVHLGALQCDSTTERRVQEMSLPQGGVVVLAGLTVERVLIPEVDLVIAGRQGEGTFERLRRGLDVQSRILRLVHLADRFSLADVPHVEVDMVRVRRPDTLLATLSGIETTGRGDVARLNVRQVQFARRAGAVLTLRGLEGQLQATSASVQGTATLDVVLGPFESGREQGFRLNVENLNGGSPDVSFELE